MFDTNLYKLNKKYLIFSICAIIVLIVLNLFLNSDSIPNTTLGKASTPIHKFVINEIMTSNKGAYVDSNGDLYDWIELYNGTSSDIELKNYGLSDEESGEVEWVFPDVVLKSNEYLIIFLCGIDREGLYANFALNKDGNELLTLKRVDGKVIDSVRTIKLNKNSTMARDENGNWTITDLITPGFSNSKSGREKYVLNSSKIVDSDLVLTEFLPANEGNVVFNDDKLYSYVELTNLGDKPINLNDYYLSDDINLIYKWRLPDKVLESNETYLIYMNGIDKENNASFDLKHKAGVVILAKSGGIVEMVSYEELTNGLAYIKKDGNWTIGSNISPGYPNTSSGLREFQKELDVRDEGLIINEVMSSNNSFLAHHGNQYYDWIELYNNSGKSINLKDYAISIDRNDTSMYEFGDVTLKPYEYYVVFASGDISLSDNNYTHVNFKLSSGKGVYLFKKGKLIDCLYINAIPSGGSYGTGKLYGHYYYTIPTPLKPNPENGISEFLQSPVFSKNGGVYNKVSSLSISIKGEGSIYYTLDGTTPTDKSNKYSQPIVLTSTTVIKAISYNEDGISSDVVTNSYIINENHTLPVVSLSLPPTDFNSIYSNINADISKFAHVELYDNNSSFSIDCDLKLSGGESKNLSKKSFSLKFSYGNLKYKVFDDRDILEFNKLVLRSGSQDQDIAMMRDELFSSIVINYGTLDAQANKPIVLYINGKYWGIYYIREKLDDNYINSNYNVGGITNVINYDYTVGDGDNEGVLKLKKYISSHNMNDPEAYNEVSKMLDLDNYIDFWVYQFIISNTDIHNYKYYSNPNIADGKIRMMLYDLDYGLRSSYDSYYLVFIQNPRFALTPIDTTILKGLMKSDAFKKRFIEREAYYLKNVFTEENINRGFDKLYNAIKPEMERNCNRWNFSFSQWDKNTQSLKKASLARADEVKKATKVYFELSQEELDEYFK